MELTGSERVLDLDCGYGRHSLALARRGFTVAGVDITPVYMEDATQNAAKEALPAEFILSDIRDVSFDNEFDVVLNLADGAIGYLETDEENLKIFDIFSKALKQGGKHFMSICNAEHAERYFPKTNWEIGEHTLALAQFGWNPKTRRMTYGGWHVPYGEPAEKPCINMEDADPIRLYSLAELDGILAHRDMKIVSSFSGCHGAPSSEKELELWVYSRKKHRNINITKPKPRT